MDKELIATYKIHEWTKPFKDFYLPIAMQKGVVEYKILCIVFNTLESHFFYDWHSSPYEVRVACKHNYVEWIYKMIQSFGYPPMYKNNI